MKLLWAALGQVLFISTAIAGTGQRIELSCLTAALFQPQVRSDPASRAKVPEPSLIQAAELRIRQEFKEEYALTSPLEKAGFANLLLGMASEKSDDPGTRYVLLREAMNAASQAGDLATTLWAIDRMANVFEMDVRPLREKVLSEAERVAAKPEDFWRLAQGRLIMAEEAVAVAQTDVAEKSAKEAAAHAGRAKSLFLAARASALLKEVSGQKARYDQVRKALETLEITPGDPGANLIAGQHGCFVRDDWEIGLRMLAKGSDAAMKALADRDLANPTEAAEQILVGDGWWTLAETKGGTAKDPLRKRAEFWYRKAAGAVPDQLRKRIDERLQELEDELAAASSVDLLRLIEPKRDTVLGEWEFEGKSLVCRQEIIAARLQIPYLPPEEYDVAIVAQRTSGCEAINLGLSQGTVKFNMVIDGYARTGYASGLALIDGKFANANPTTRPGPLLIQGRPSTIECSVRKTGVSMKVDGRLIFEWSGAFSRLSSYDALKTPHPRALFISGWDSQYRFSSFVLLPVSGKGEVLR